MAMTLQDRCDAYAAAFPDWPAPSVQQGRIYGIWFLGNDYRGSGYHGAFPPNFVKRVMSMFPGMGNVLHLFSGSLPKGDYTRFDAREDIEAEIHGDAESLSTHLAPSWADLIIADPPYTGEDAEKYGQPMVNRNRVVEECHKVLRPGGFLIWLDQVMPMYRKVDWDLAGVIGIFRSTNHRFRCCCIFQAKEGAS